MHVSILISKHNANLKDAYTNPIVGEKIDRIICISVFLPIKEA